MPVKPPVQPLSQSRLKSRPTTTKFDEVTATSTPPSASQDAPALPPAPTSIHKGSSLKDLLGPVALRQLAHNLRSAYASFDTEGFVQAAQQGLEPLGIMQRGEHVAQVLRRFLPARYRDAMEVLLASLTPALTQTTDLGLQVFFYLPHVCFVARYGLDAQGNGGDDPFEVSMQAQHALTQRFSAEFSIRPFLLRRQHETLALLQRWTQDPSPHVRRLCSEGTRPRLPWAAHIEAFKRDPKLTLPLLHALRDDPSLYVRRSVANHLGDVAKHHLEWTLALCEDWLTGAGEERCWLIRHALRHPARQGHARALALRAQARA